MKVRYFLKRAQWWIDFKDAQGRRARLPTGCATEAAAQREAPAIIARRLAGDAAAPSSNTNVPQKATIPDSGRSLGDAFKLALRTREKWIESKAQGTLQATFDAICATLPRGVETPMGLLDRDFVRELRGKWLKEDGKRRGTTLSASTINHRLSMLSVLLEVCDMPPHMVKHLSTKGTRRTRRISDRELQATVAWCLRSTRENVLDFLDLVELGMETGAREGELLGVDPRDVVQGGRLDTPQGPVEVAGMVTFRDTKNGTSRTIPLTQRAWAIYERRRAPQGFFTGLTKYRVVALWAAMRKDMGLAEDHEFVFHTLRHEVASRMADRNENPFVIQAILGHSSIATTQIYVKASLGAMAAAMGGVRTGPTPL